MSVSTSTNGCLSLQLRPYEYEYCRSVGKRTYAGQALNTTALRHNEDVWEPPNGWVQRHAKKVDQITPRAQIIDQINVRHVKRVRCNNLFARTGLPTLPLLIFSIPLLHTYLKFYSKLFLKSERTGEAVRSVARAKIHNASRPIPTNTIDKPS
jgi:hypothetical protein